MSPSASEAAASRVSGTRGERGLTLVEIAVALAVSGLLVGSLAFFFKSFGRTFNVQEQIADRDLNAHYTVKRLSEVLMSAGANLPSKGWEIIAATADGMRLAVNPRGGIQYVSGPVAGFELPVDDAKGFAGAEAVLVVPADRTAKPYKVGIDASWSGGGFADGVKPEGTGARLRLRGPVNLAPGDVAYAYAEEEYRLRGTDLMLGNMVLAENIESLSLSFLSAGQAPTNQWSEMRSARVRIRGRTRLPDPGLPADGGYRKIELSTDVLLRNRL